MTHFAVEGRGKYVDKALEVESESRRQKLGWLTGSSVLAAAQHAKLYSDLLQA